MKTYLTTVLALGLAAGAFADNAKEEAAIRAQAAKFDTAFNTKDAKQIAAFWAPDGDIINPAGIKASGRADVEKLIAGDLGTFFGPGVTSKLTVNSVRFLKPDVAIADCTHEIIGNKGPDGAIMPPLKVSVTTVTVKAAGQWWWTAVRPCIPPPPPPGMKPAAGAPASGAASTPMAAGGLKAPGMSK